MDIIKKSLKENGFRKAITNNKKTIYIKGVNGVTFNKDFKNHVQIIINNDSNFYDIAETEKIINIINSIQEI